MSAYTVTIFNNSKDRQSYFLYAEPPRVTAFDGQQGGLAINVFPTVWMSWSNIAPGGGASVRLYSLDDHAFWCRRQTTPSSPALFPGTVIVPAETTPVSLRPWGSSLRFHSHPQNRFEYSMEDKPPRGSFRITSPPNLYNPHPSSSSTPRSNNPSPLPSPSTSAPSPLPRSPRPAPPPPLSPSSLPSASSSSAPPLPPAQSLPPDVAPSPSPAPTPSLAPASAPAVAPFLTPGPPAPLAAPPAPPSPSSAPSTPPPSAPSLVLFGIAREDDVARKVPVAGFIAVAATIYTVTPSSTLRVAVGAAPACSLVDLRVIGPSQAVDFAGRSEKAVAVTDMGLGLFDVVYEGEEEHVPAPGPGRGLPSTAPAGMDAGAADGEQARAGGGEGARRETPEPGPAPGCGGGCSVQ